MALPMLFCNIELKIYVPDGLGGKAVGSLGSSLPNAGLAYSIINALNVVRSLFCLQV